MSFVRANPLGWGLFETFYSLQCNLMDLQGSRAVDGHAGGTYNPTAAIVINNQFEADSTGAAGANVIGIIATGKGTSNGIETTGGSASGNGIRSTGGLPDGMGVDAYGKGSGTGVSGEGGASTGIGVYGKGGATDGTGVWGSGGAVNGFGVIGVGAGAGTGVKGTGGGTSGYGVHGVGGGPNGLGVHGQGTGTGVGIQGTGGGTSGSGVQGIGGAPDGMGVDALAVGAGAAVKMTRVGGVHMHMVPRTGDPTAPVNGDVWLENDNDEIIAKVGGDLHQVLDTWVYLSVAVGAGPGNITIHGQNNVASVTKNATRIFINFQRFFAVTDYSVNATPGPAVSYYANVGARAVGVVEIHIYDGIAAGVLVDPEANAFDLNVHIKGYFA